MRSVKSVMTCPRSRTLLKSHVIDDIDDSFLASEWERLANQGDVFPQNSYAWCAGWWKYLRGKRELHVVMVANENGQTVGIVPLCLEHCCGVRVLRSFPVNFGDFFQILVSPEVRTEDIFEAAWAYLNQHTRWRSVLLSPVNDHSALYAFLARKKCASKRLVGNIVADIRAPSWDDYLGHLSQHRRKMMRKKIRTLETEHDVTLEVIRDREGYLQWFDKIREMIDVRGRKDRPQRSDAYMECVKETHSQLFSRGQMMLFVLRAGETMIAYRIGIIQGRTYYDWNTNYDPAWQRYSPGLVCVAYVIRQLIEEGFTKYDHMAGVYNYKLGFSPQHEMRHNYLFVMGDRSLPSAMFREYQLVWRDRVKPYYQRYVRPIFK